MAAGGSIGARAISAGGALALGALLAACGNSAAQSPPAAAGSPAATVTTPALAPVVTVQGPAAAQCTLFESVYQQITAATTDETTDSVLGGTLNASGTTWQQELDGAARAGGVATTQSVEMEQAALDIGFASLDVDVTGPTSVDWAKAAGVLRQAQLACTGQ
jgi:hypothetical protein